MAPVKGARQSIIVARVFNSLPWVARKKWFDSHAAPAAIKETSAKRHLDGGCKKRGYKWRRGLCISGAVQKTRAAVTGSPPQLWLTGHRRRLYLKRDWITLTFHPLLKPIIKVLFMVDWTQEPPIFEWSNPPHPHTTFRPLLPNTFYGQPLDTEGAYIWG